MNTAIRWRIITLQTVLVVVLAAASGFAFFEGMFVTNMIHDELVSQQIYFPGTDQIKAGGALDPAEFPAEIRDYAGTQVDNGDKARVYANDFIAKHLQGVANGETYSQVSTQLIADNAKLAAMSKDDPGYAALQQRINTESAQRTTLFQGDTLRSSLLNAYGWYTFGTYTIWAGIGLMLAALVVLGALAFELFVAGRKPENIKFARKIAA
ncbi:MAG TPA: hypothetical protein VKT20_13220 [Candidatus Dormibacteraeota bacterium]|nr:hypothetical protein [Candidatus Dormibacteraeota bacterium]